MNLYLVIITTVLVITQIIRVIQNTISLARQNDEIMKTCDWIKDNDITYTDFQTQREVFYLLHEKLIRERDEPEEKI